MAERNTTPYDVFISYAPADRAWVWGWLLPRLRANGVTVCIDQECFDIGAPELENIQRAVESSRHTLLVLSSAWANSEWQNFAGLLARSDDPVGYRRRTIPLVLEPCQPPRSIARLIAADFTDIGKRDDQLARLMEALRGNRHRTVCGPPLGALQGLDIPMIFDFMRNPHFVGREQELVALHDLLDESRPLALSSALSAPITGPRLAGLSGLGGIGKTQLAVEYVYRFKDAYPGGVFWITITASGQGHEGDSPAGANAYQALADGLAVIGQTIIGNEADKPRRELVRIAADYLRADPEVLLVLDNLSDPGLLNRPVEGILNLAALPCRVLFTTRRRNLGEYRVMDVGTLPPDQALRLLLRHESRRAVLNPTHAEHAEAQNICAVLGYLPLALELAGAHLGGRPELPLTRYREDLETRRPLLVLDDPRSGVRTTDLPTRHIAAVEATIASQWDTLKNIDASLLLRVAGQLPEAEVIPAARLGLLAGISDHADNFFGSPLTLALDELHNASLVERVQKDQVRLHPLVREFAAARTPSSQTTIFRQQCAAHLQHSYSDVAVLEQHCVHRGIGALQKDLIMALELASENTSVYSDLHTLLRLIQRESHSLAGWHPDIQPAFFAQQVYKCAIDSGFDAQATSARHRLVSLRQPFLALNWRAGPKPRELVRTFTEDGHWIFAVSLTPDGYKIISGSDDRVLKIRNLETGEEECVLVGHKDHIVAVAVTLDGQHVVSASADRTLKVWNLGTGAEEHTLIGHTDSVCAVAVTADGHRVISGSEDNTLKIWELETGQEERTFVGHTDRVCAVTVTADGHHLISGSKDSTLKIWNLETGQEECTLVGHSKRISAVALVDKQRVISASDDRTLKVWNLETGQEERTLTGHDDQVWAVAVMADGRRAISGSADNTLKIWNLQTGQEERTLAGHSEPVWTVAVTTDGRTAVSGSADSTIRVWDISSALDMGLEMSHIARTLVGHDSEVCAMAIAPDGRYAASGSYNLWEWVSTFKIWDLDKGQEVRTLSRLGVGLSKVMVMMDQRRWWAVSGSMDNALKVWSLKTGGEMHTIPKSGGAVSAVAIVPDGSRAVFASDNRVLTVWDLVSEKVECSLVGHGGGVRAIALTPDGRRAIYAGSDSTITLWDVASGKEDRSFAGHDGGVISVAVTGDSRRAVSGSYDGTLRVWDLETGQQERMLVGHSKPVSAVAVSPDGRLAISGAEDYRVKIWNLQTARELASIHLEGRITSVILDAGGVRILVGDSAGNVYCLEYMEAGQDVQSKKMETEMPVTTTRPKASLLKRLVGVIRGQR